MEKQVYSLALKQNKLKQEQNNKPRISLCGTVGHCSEVIDRLLESPDEGGDLECRA